MELSGCYDRWIEPKEQANGAHWIASGYWGWIRRFGRARSIVCRIRHIRWHNHGHICWNCCKTSVIGSPFSSTPLQCQDVVAPPPQRRRCVLARKIYVPCLIPIVNREAEKLTTWYDGRRPPKIRLVSPRPMWICRKTKESVQSYEISTRYRIDTRAPDTLTYCCTTTVTKLVYKNAGSRNFDRYAMYTWRESNVDYAMRSLSKS